MEVSYDGTSSEAVHERMIALRLFAKTSMEITLGRWVVDELMSIATNV